MIWIGAAFRPPRRDDDEGWQVAERLVAAGFRYHSTRRRTRVPRTLAELEAWTTARDAPDAWRPEEQPTIATGPRGVEVRARGRTLHHGEALLVRVGRSWREGRLKLLGDGGRPLATAVVVLEGSKVHTLGPRSRIRVART